MLISIDQRTPKCSHAGSKAREDATIILEELGATAKNMECSYNKAIVDIVHDLFGMNHELIRIAKECRSGDIAVLQFPYRCFLSLAGNRFVRKLHNRGAQSVLLIHDLDSLRRANALERMGQFSLSESLHCDIAFLRQFDWVISHNIRMTEYLATMGYPESRIVNLDLFDYLGTIHERTYENVPRNVSFAGNLTPAKSGFIYDLKGLQMSKEVSVNLFGNGYSGDTNDRWFSHGAVNPGELPFALPNGFGLVWDGPSALTCTGVYGDYLRFNNPHKLSLYYASGLVPIVWSKSAAASFVKKTNSGFCIDSLLDLSDLIESCSIGEYESKMSNVRTIQDNVTKGYYLKRAINEVISRNQRFSSDDGD